MGFPFDDTDGPDWRPEHIADALAHGESLESSMNSVYLDENGDAPDWDEFDVETVKERYAELAAPDWDEFDVETVKERYAELAEESPHLYPPEKLKTAFPE